MKTREREGKEKKKLLESESKKKEITSSYVTRPLLLHFCQTIGKVWPRPRVEHSCSVAIVNVAKCSRQRPVQTRRLTRGTRRCENYDRTFRPFNFSKYIHTQFGRGIPATEGCIPPHNRYSSPQRDPVPLFKEEREFRGMTRVCFFALIKKNTSVLLAFLKKKKIKKKKV